MCMTVSNVRASEAISALKASFYLNLSIAVREACASKVIGYALVVDLR